MSRWVVQFSWRYGVMGIYKDRAWPLLHIYPVPFVKVSIHYGSLLG